MRKMIFPSATADLFFSVSSKYEAIKRIFSAKDFIADFFSIMPFCVDVSGLSFYNRKVKNGVKMIFKITFFNKKIGKWTKNEIKLKMRIKAKNRQNPRVAKQLTDANALGIRTGQRGCNRRQRTGFAIANEAERFEGLVASHGRGVHYDQHRARGVAPVNLCDLFFVYNLVFALILAILKFSFFEFEAFC